MRPAVDGAVHQSRAVPSEEEGLGEREKGLRDGATLRTEQREGAVYAWLGVDRGKKVHGRGEVVTTRAGGGARERGHDSRRRVARTREGEIFRVGAVSERSRSKILALRK